MRLFSQFICNILTFYTTEMDVCVPHYYCICAADLSDCTLCQNTFTFPLQCRTDTLLLLHPKRPCSAVLFCVSLSGGHRTGKFSILRILNNTITLYDTFHIRFLIS